MKKSFKISGLAIALGAIILCTSAMVSTTLYAPYYKLTNGAGLFTGKIDTVAGAATDSQKLHIPGNLTSIAFTTDVYNCTAVTPTLSTTVALYGSANGGVSYDNTPLFTYTVVPNAYNATNPKTRSFVVNGPYGGNPYEDYVWVTTGGGASCTVGMQSWFRKH